MSEQQHSFSIENERDIYFPEKTIAKHTPEHLVQAGLGSPVVVTGLIDESTNNIFGSTIDKSLLESVHPYRALLSGRSRKGRPLSVVSDDGTYSMEGGKPTFQAKTGNGDRPWQVERAEDGSARIQVTGNSLDKVARLALHAVRAEGMDEKAMTGIEAVSVKSVPPELCFSTTIGGDGFLHAIAKSLFNIVAHQVGPSTALESGFDEIRQYVLDGVCLLKEQRRDYNGRSMCSPNARFSCEAETGGDNSLLSSFSVRGDKKTGIIYGVAMLLGHLPFSCLINDSWRGNDFACVLAADLNPMDPWWDYKALDPSTMPPVSIGSLLVPRWSDDDIASANGAIGHSVQAAVLWNTVKGEFRNYTQKGIDGLSAMHRAIADVLSPQTSESPVEAEAVLSLILEEAARSKSRQR